MSFLTQLPKNRFIKYKIVAFFDFFECSTRLTIEKSLGTYRQNKRKKQKYPQILWYKRRKSRPNCKFYIIPKIGAPSK